MSSKLKLMSRRSTLPESKTIQKNQTKILELNNSINEMKNTLEIFWNRADLMNKRISKFKDRNLEIIKMEEQRKLRLK